MQRATHVLILTNILLMITSSVCADVVRGDDPPEITDIYTDLAEWLVATPPVTVIDFTGFSPGTIITDQYADQGVNFVDGLYWINHSAFNDEFGLANNPFGSGRIIMQFDEPLNMFGVMFPGVTWYQFYLEGDFVGWTEAQSCISPGCFAGFILDIDFDEVHVINWSGSANIDNLYFTFAPIPAPGALALLGFAGIAFRRSRRRHHGVSQRAGGATILSG